MSKINISNILRSNQTVFTFKEILLATEQKNPRLLARQLNYYVKTGVLHHIRRGLYGKDKNYDRLEAATKICTPAYISFETVTLRSGMTFQLYSTIFIASYQSKEIICDGQTYQFKKINYKKLTNNAGIEKGN